MFTGLTSLWPVVASFLLVALLTPAVRAAARRIGAVAAPNDARWHRKPTALLGGVAVFVPVAIGCLLVPASRNGLVVLAASTFLFLVGLLDDFVHIKPYQKLIGQIVGAAAVVYFGLTLPWSGSPAINIAVTIFWLVGITNALNLLDNMDGLAAGIACIASIFLALHFLHNQQTTEALMLGVFAAALIGFLMFNSHPASIFMGDCGSMFIGFFLAGTALLAAAGTAGRTRTLLPVLAVPVLILFIPIFDTTLVTLIRKVSGRAASQGGRDHTSHRLVALGMSERSAVWMLYGLATVSGLIAVVVRDRALDISLAAIVTFTTALALAGVYLAGVKVYDEADLARNRERPLVAFLVDLSYKRRIFEVLLDVVLVGLAYYLAHALLFGPFQDRQPWDAFLATLPLVLAIKMAAFLALGVYRGLWRYVSVADAVVYVKGVAVGAAGSVLAVLVTFGLEGFFPAVFALDAILLLLLVTISRFAFRIFGSLLPRSPLATGRRVMIFGAGDAGELLLRELRNNRELQYVPVGFFDDDIRKVGKVLHGLEVFPCADVGTVCRELRIEEAIISSGTFSEDRVQTFIREIGMGVSMKRMKIQLEAVTLSDRNERVPASDPETQVSVAAEPTIPLLTVSRD